MIDVRIILSGLWVALMLTYPEARNLFKPLAAVVVDEWHELLGSKRGVLTQLALARLRRW